MDATDKTILRLLQSDATLSIEKIGEQIGLSHSPVWRRIDRLQKDKVIEGSGYRINRRAVGLNLVVFASIKLSRHDEKALNEFERAIRNVPAMVECYAMSGQYDYLIKIITGSVENYEELLRRLLVNLPHFQDVYTNFVLREIKHSHGIPI